MKKLTLLLLAFALCWDANAQSPDRVNYQAVARDNAGNVLANQPVSFRISILEGSSGGNTVYSETHNMSTNGFGLANMQIGGGSVLSGNFATIDWGNNLHFVQIEMDETGGSNYQVMGTSQLVSVPYAFHARTVENDLVDDADADPANEIQTLSMNGADVSISSGNTITLLDNDATNEIQTLSMNGSDLTISGGNTVTLTGGNTLDMAYDQGGAGAGAAINADAGAVVVSTAGASAIALDIDNTNTGVGITANTTNPANTFSAIQGNTNSTSSAASAIIGNSDGVAWGVSGQVSAGATAESGIYGSNLRTNGGHGVLGIGFNGTVGQTNYSSGNASYSENFDAIAPLGNGIGAAGKGFYGVVGEDRYLGGVPGAYGVFSNGNLAATGTKTFIIDHPDDPANKALRHFSIESNEVLNVYRGNAAFDANGEAVVMLPDYFDKINRNFSYQLTPVGGFAQLYVKEKIANNRFVIAGGQSGMEVSWAVYAERNDAYLQQHPDQRNVVIDKREGQKGKYFMPELHGQGADSAIFPRYQPYEQTELNVIDK